MPASRPTVVLAAVLLVSLVPPTGGAASHALGVDAGDSASAAPGDAITTAPVILGGQDPYTYAWTYDGSAARFEDPAAAVTTFDTTSLPAGPVTLTLTVTDANGTQASDTVQHAIASPTPLLEVQGNVTAGVPDELVTTGAVDPQEHPFTVPAGTAAIQAVLSWTAQDPSAISDLDLELWDPSGSDPTANQGETSANPETVRVTAPEAGDWTARVKPWLTGPATYTLTITAFQAPVLPTARTSGPFNIGYAETDAQLFGEARQGTLAQGAWDLDLDGTYETAGAEPVVDLPTGEHPVAFKVTDPDGYEARATTTVTVLEDVPRVLRFACTERPHAPTVSMEFSNAHGTCWAHHGHQTFSFDETHVLTGGTGLLVSVEQQYAPPSEYELPTDTPIHVQVSMDGQTWTEVATVPYEFLFLNDRQKIFFDLEVDDEPFRYFRMHNPRSVSQGLSGFLDQSKIDLFVEEGQDPPAPGPIQEGQRTLTCEDGDVMEDFFESHPCWFGGIDRYDSPSVYHTYTLDGVASLEELSGTFQVAPWRSDDWFLPVPDVTDEATREAYLEQLTQTRVHVQTSVDGQVWEDVAVVTAPFGQETSYEVTLDEPEPARFVRYVPDHHPETGEFATNAPLHHPEAYFLHTDVTVGGMLPG